jgi:DNA-binding NarL/FixJ family response regulator
MIRILIVDDHALLREGLKTVLAAQPDFEVVGESGSAESLTDLVEAAQPDVVVLDALLPGVSGPEACRRLRSTHRDVRVLILTTFLDDQLVDECIDAGANGYVVKDVEQFALVDNIRAVYRGDGVLAPSVAGRLLARLQGDDRPPTTTPRPALNDNQLQILRLIGEGNTNREIAKEVHLSELTVKSYLQDIYRKLGVRNRVEAALVATREGWI